MATLLYDANWVEDTLRHMADQIMADPLRGQGRALVGVRTRGAAMADRLAGLIRAGGVQLPVGYIDATMFRDDLHTGSGLKQIKGTEIDFDLNERAVVLVDDVISTGRTVRAAMDALFSYGRPACVRLCVMLDRGGRELPLAPDFAGAHVDIPKGAYVRLKLREVDDREDAVYVVGAGEEEPA